MNIRKKIYILLGQVALIIVSLLIFSNSNSAIRAYNRFMYYPVQWLRDVFLGFLPFSVGDIAYIAAGLGLLWAVILWVRYLFTYRSNKGRLAASVVGTLNVLAFVYLFFTFGWGINYYKQPLAKSWRLAGGRQDTLRLSVYDSFLVDRLNTLAPSFRQIPLDEVSDIARDNYNRLTNSPLKSHGLNIKTSIFGYFLDRTAIHGYYNPFTGEGQVSGMLPGFMQPFVVTHEMAHQLGIAAEGDANLMAYAVSTLSSHANFKYSAYFSMWLYVDRRLYRRDSLLANKFRQRLNPLTRAHIVTLDSLSELYDNDISHYSSQLYDNYLKMQQQKDGIKSYGSVVYNAWLLDQRRAAKKDDLLEIP